MDKLAAWKGKLSEGLKNLTAPLDPHERRVFDLVDKATSEQLPSPDWGLNMELVDLINGDPTECADKVVRALRRALLKPSVQVQLLALTALETCVKNCVPYFFQHLITSELWQEMMDVRDPYRRWDPEVRDRILCLVEDFAKGLPLPAYRAAFESLVDQGVDFPVRTEAPGEEGVPAAPYYTPPELPPPRAVVPPAGDPTSSAAAGDAALSEADRAAIAAAMADLEAQEQAREAALVPPGMPPAGHVPAMMGPAVLMGGAIRPPGYRPPADYAPVPPSGAAPPATVAGAVTLAGEAAPAGGPASQPAGGTIGLPRSEAEGEQAVKVALNSAELLAEMLEPLSAPGGDLASVREVFISDLADQCYRYRSILAEYIPTVGSEALVERALGANDNLTLALNTYERLVRAAGGTAQVGPSAGGFAAAQSPLPAAAQPPPEGAFTLGDDEEDDGAGLALSSTRRSAAVGAGQHSAAAVETPAVRATGGASTCTAAGSSGHGRQDTDALVQQMDDLVMSAGAGHGGSSSAGPSAAAAAAQQ